MEIQGVPYSQEIVCATVNQKDHGNSFLGFRRCSAFGIHATRDNHYLDTPMLPQWWLYARISNKRHGKLSADVLLHQDNAPAHKSRTSLAAVRTFVAL